MDLNLSLWGHADAVEGSGSEESKYCAKAATKDEEWIPIVVGTRPAAEVLW